MFNKIKLFLSDVDGVMTDAGMYYTESGEEFKKFNTHDGMGFNLLTKAGVKTGIITTEYTKIFERRAAKLKIDYVYQGRGFGSKLEAVKEICLKEGISLKETSYIGDDINCIELLQEVGIAACPANAVEQVKNIKGIIHLEKKGGEGAVREFIEMLFKQGLIEGNK
jgi:YrbI family 3-deoxy-D-manno-octulosonate 8-phosphate phosphatase